VKTFHIVTFGCQMNVHDSEKMAGILCTAGFVPVSSEEAADIVIINTCSVREKAERKLYSHLGNLHGRRRGGAGPLVIGVAGCVAQQEGAALLERAPDVRFVLGTHQVHAVADVVESLGLGTDSTVRTAMESRIREVDPGTAMRGHTGRAMVTVMEGCDKFCSYCIVPFTRGRERCRKMTDILAEVECLADRGYGEVQLLGQNVNCWVEGDIDFVDLLKSLEGCDIRWMRFITSHPAHFTDELADWLGRSQKLCPQLHFPVQSGSDRVLEAMKREYTREQYVERVTAIRRARPGIALSTDVIVGFPGETESEFEETMELVKALQFDSMFSFVYSPRKFSAATRLADDVAREIKIERLTRLQALQRSIQTVKHRSMLGSELEVLVDGPSRRDPSQLAGHSACNRVVNFPKGASPVASGAFVRVRITGFGPNSLSGELVG